MKDIKILGVDIAKKATPRISLRFIRVTSNF